MTGDVIILFDLPDEPLTLNKIPGTAGGAKAWRKTKNAWWEAAYYGAVAAFPGVGPEGRRMPPCDVYVQIPVWGQRIRDAGNWTATTKPIIDGVTAAGVWPDDGPEWVAEQPVTFRLVQNRRDLMKSKVVVRLVPR